MRVPLSWLREYVELGDDAASIAKALTMAGVGVEGVDGDVLILEITSNRADLLSILGVARELSVLKGAKLKPPVLALKEGEAAVGTPVLVADRKLCPRYTARVVRGVKIAPAPVWIQQKLKAALGAEYVPVNNVVDITNLVMLECGQPLHAFDLDRLGGNRLEVRPAKAGEKMAAINGRECALQKDDLVIADAERPVAIAGVMGGKESGITEATRNVLLESAMFDPVSVRRTGRRLGLSSESSYRFERGVDWATVEWASQRAAQLMAECASGTVAKGLVDVSVPAPVRASVTVRFDRLNSLLGMTVAPERVTAIIQGLGGQMLTRNAQQAVVSAPAGRRDLTQEVDFIEEVARIEGYDAIPTDVQLGLTVARDRAEDLVRDAVRTALTSMGVFEVLTWSFEDATAMPAVTFWSSQSLLPLRNPNGHVDRTLRNSLGPGLAKVLRTNEGCGEPLRPIFEIANVYFGKAGLEPPGEKCILGIAHPGGLADLRALVSALFGRLQIRSASGAVMVDGVPEGEAVLLGTELIGYLGRLERFAVGEIDFDRLCGAARLIRKVSAYSSHPAVRRDLAMVFDREVTWFQVESVIREQAIPILQEASYLNHFEGRQIGEGKRSVAVSLSFLSAERTLTGAEVDAAVSRVAGALAVRLKGVRR